MEKQKKAFRFIIINIDKAGRLKDDLSPFYL